MSRIIITGPEGEMVEIEDTGEVIPVWYINDWYVRHRHTVDIQSAIDALNMIKDWEKENGNIQDKQRND